MQTLKRKKKAKKKTRCRSEHLWSFELRCTCTALFCEPATLWGAKRIDSVESTTTIILIWRDTLSSCGHIFSRICCHRLPILWWDIDASSGYLSPIPSVTSWHWSSSSESQHVSQILVQLSFDMTWAILSTATDVLGWRLFPWLSPFFILMY